MAKVPNLIPFRVEHLFTFRERDRAWPQDLRQAIEKSRGIAFTGEIDGKILGCAGIEIAWPGMGVAWMVLAGDMAKYSIWMTRTVRNVLRDVIRAYQLHRVELLVLEGNERNARWAQMLGFERENGKARYYTSDKRHIVRYEFINDDLI